MFGCPLKLILGFFMFLVINQNYNLEDYHPKNWLDWASDLEDSKSTMGFVSMMGNGAISWNSKQQPTIPLSTT
jgi:hypothetical protein